MARNVRFHHRVSIITVRQRQGLIPLRRFFYDRDADGGSFRCRLHDDRPPQFRGPQCLRTREPFASLDDKTRRHGNPVSGENSLGGHLVHPNRAGLDARSGVRDPQGLQEALNRAVFSSGTMQCEKGHSDLLILQVLA